MRFNQTEGLSVPELFERFRESRDKEWVPALLWKSCPQMSKIKSGEMNGQNMGSQQTEPPNFFQRSYPICETLHGWIKTKHFRARNISSQYYAEGLVLTPFPVRPPAWLGNKGHAQGCWSSLGLGQLPWSLTWPGAGLTEVIRISLLKVPGWDGAHLALFTFGITLLGLELGSALWCLCPENKFINNTRSPSLLLA